MMTNLMSKCYLNSEYKADFKESLLIQDVANRAKLLHRETKEFTLEEREVIRKGERAIGQLLSAHRGLILQLVATYKVKGYNSTLSDLEQEATLAFLNALISFDPNKGGILATWAYFQIRARLQRITRQAIHNAIARARSMQSEQVFSSPYPELDQGFFEQIRFLINKLTEKQRQVVFFYLDGLGWAEIALKLQSTVDGVRMVWTRSVQQLRLLLLGERQQEKHYSKVSESPTAVQSSNFSESPTAVKSNNFINLLLKRLFQHVSPLSIFLRLFSKADNKMQKVKERNQKDNQVQNCLSYNDLCTKWKNRHNTTNVECRDKTEKSYNEIDHIEREPRGSLVVSLYTLVVYKAPAREVQVFLSDRRFVHFVPDFLSSPISNKSESYRFWSDPSCSKAARGSPSIFWLLKRLAVSHDWYQLKVFTSTIKSHIMYTTSQKQNRFLITSSRVRLTRFDKWWASLLPLALKKILPPWQVSALLVTLMAFYAEDQFFSTMIVLFWVSMSFSWLFRKLRRYVGHYTWLIPAYHVGLSFLILTPVLAQNAPTGNAPTGSACTTSGLFSAVTTFVSNLFSTVTFGGVGGGTLSGLICQVVGFLTISLLLGFLGVIGYVGFQIGYQRQPVSTVLDPLMGFLVFAGGSTVIIGVMVGTGGGNGGGPVVG